MQRILNEQCVQSHLAISAMGRKHFLLSPIKLLLTIQDKYCILHKECMDQQMILLLQSMMNFVGM